jgi:hypothetical protein
LKAKNERAGILWLVLGLVVAAAHQDRRVVAGRHANLMREDSAIQRSRLCDLLADRAIRLDPVHRDAAGVVVGGEREGAGVIDRHVDRARAQRD